MITYLAWLAVAVVVAACCAATARRLWAKRGDLPCVSAVDGLARLSAGRDHVQFYARLGLAAAVGAFSVLVALGAVLGLVTGGA
jgi:hypothetical protein